MSSHRKGSNTYSTSASSEDYKRLFDRLEQEFNIDELNENNLRNFFKRDNSLIDQLALTTDLYTQIINAETLSELSNAREQLPGLLIHKDKLRDLIHDRQLEIEAKEREERIAYSIARTQDFAKSRNIVLNEVNKGGIYERWGRYKRTAIVIFGKKGIRAWRYI
jgi:hypothetical protein